MHSLKLNLKCKTNRSLLTSGGYERMCYVRNEQACGFAKQENKRNQRDHN